MSTPDATRGRFAKTADRIGELQDARAADLAEHVRRFVLPQGDERVLDSGTGAGALALALAPLVREVVGVDVVPEMLEQARKRAAAFSNVTFVEGDATKLPFEPGSFDLACSIRTLHHIARPELAVAELARDPARRTRFRRRSDCARRSARRARAEPLREGSRPKPYPHAG